MTPPARSRVPRRAAIPPPAEFAADAVVCGVRVTGPAAPDDLAALHGGITAGPLGGPWRNGLPGYVWSRADGQIREFRLADPEKGDYVVYELHPSEWPEGLE